MKHPEVLTGGRNARHCVSSKTNNNITISKRSITMNSFNLIRKAGFSAIVLILMAAVAFGQGSLKVKNNITGSGTINVKKDVDNSGASAAVSINPVVRLNGTGTQNIGIATAPAILFKSLRSEATGPKQQNVVVAADSLFYNMTGGTWTLNGQKLTINDTVRNDGSVVPAYTSGRVVYARATGSRSILGGTGMNYDTLEISGGANFVLQSAFAADTIYHSAGSLTIDKALTVNQGASLASVADVTAAVGLGSSRTSFSALVNNNNTITVNAGALEVTAMTDNNGTIVASGVGPMTFGASANHGTITGGTGLVTFSNSLAQHGGTIAAGSGDMLFSGAVTADNGSITAANATDSLRFASTLGLSGTSSLSATSGSVRFDGAITGSSLFSLGSASSAYFVDLNAIPAATYGNLYAENAAKTTSGAVSVAGNLYLNQNITPSDSISLTANTSTVIGTGEVLGKVNRSHSFPVGGNYTFNRADVYLGFANVAPTVGNVSLTMAEATPPSNPPATKYINRNYTFQGTAPGNIQNMQLYYNAGAEIVGANEDKLGVRAYNGSSWAKMFNTGYTRNSGSGLVTVSGLAYNPVGVSEFMMSQVGLVSTVTGSWANSGTWDESYVPDAGDDVTILATHTVTVDAADSAASVDLEGGTLTIGAGGSLAVSDYLVTASGTTVNVSNGNLTVSDSIGKHGNLSVASGYTVTTNLFHNNSAGTVTFTGNLSATSLTNSSGTMALNGASSAINGNVINNGTITQTSAGSLLLAQNASTNVTGIGAFNLSGAVTVGTSSNANNMTTNDLTVNNTGNLQVYGDLQVDNNLVNDGVVTVGQ